MSDAENTRQFLRADLWRKWNQLKTDQQKRLPPPPVQKPFPPEAQFIDLIASEKLAIGNLPLAEAIRRRKSHRIYTPEPLTLEELSFLLWATQGVREILYNGTYTLRTVPSGGARHPFETYLVVNRVTGLKPGVYRYLALEHKLYFLYESSDLLDKVNQACCDFAKESAVVFIWTAIPYRTEWRYGPLSPKLIAQDSGHLCQNLYLACEAIGAGACAVGAYDQEEMDKLLGVDGVDEFTVYAAPVGKVR